MKPIFVDIKDYETFKSGNDPIEVDVFSRQLKELFIIQNPHYSQNKKEAYLSDDYQNFANDMIDRYVYVYFPWNNRLVKTVEKDDYYTLKTNRNINLISPDDQQKLRKYKVAVLGMSVGSNIAHVMTQAGISERITLADFDELDTTNLNRIWAGVHQVGMNKAQIAAQRIYEDNPFAEVNLLTEGVTKENMENLLKAGEVDCIVEEVDSMPIKLEIRHLALEYKKPVIMIADNGDGVVMNVERYDLGYDKFMNKDFEYWPRKMATCKTPKDFADIVIEDMVGGTDNVDPRMMESVEMILSGKLVSWPQLGSAALLAGIVATVTIKDIVRGADTQKYRRENIFVL